MTPQLIKTLVVQDQPLFGRLLKAQLHGWFPDMVFAEAADGSRALHQVDAFDPDMVLIDLQLHGAGGLNLSRQCLAKKPGLSVILLSSYDLPEYRKAARDIGAKHLVSKDAISEDDFHCMIDRIIEEIIGLR
jgi:DNA-binding NarL/FixJ family response regulator